MKKAFLVLTIGLAIFGSGCKKKKDSNATPEGVAENKKTMEKQGVDFVNEMNNHPKYSDMPTILFPGYHQREFGCFGGGDRFLYIDSKGNLNACPFCQESAGSCLDNDLTLLINNLKAKGCPKFPKVPAF